MLLREKLRLVCVESGEEYLGDQHVIKCSKDELVRSVYNKKRIEPKDLPGIWKYIDWLPISSVPKEFLENPAAVTIYKSKGLAEYLGLKNLYIAYTGYQNGCNNTCTFKDIEAQSSISRLLEVCRDKIIVLASDGNVAKSFLHYSRFFDLKIVITTTEDARKKRIWHTGVYNKSLILLSLTNGHDYYDAIRLARMISELEGFVSEGGVRNVARRDGVGTILIEAAFKLKRLPDHYFQAVGTGIGPIAVYEAAERLIEDGRFGKEPPVIHISQNDPFIPMCDAWWRGDRRIDPRFQSEEAKKLIEQVYAHVLTNRYPAYSIRGGIYDVLKNTNGKAYAVTNEEAYKAQELFEKLEGYDIVPPAAVTIASLIKAVEQGNIDKNDLVLVHVTGGRCRSLKRLEVPATIVADSIDDAISKLLSYLGKK